MFKDAQIFFTTSNLKKEEQTYTQEDFLNLDYLEYCK